MTTCPSVHSYADHLACPYGSAYNHGIIRALWAIQIRAWRRAAETVAPHDAAEPES